MAVLNNPEIDKKVRELVKRIRFEKGKLVFPKYGVIFNVRDSASDILIGVGRVNFPIKAKPGELPEGYEVVDKNGVIRDTNNGDRYVTIYSTQYEPWVGGQLIHTDGSKHLSSNPNDTTKDNLGTLAFDDIFV